jgi:hypothetical protein
MNNARKSFNLLISAHWDIATLRLANDWTNLEEV